MSSNNLIVACFAIGEDFTDVVDRPLYLVDVLGLLPLYHQGGADDLGGCCEVEEEGLAWLRRGQDRWFGDESFEVV
jgi:hypothetical protein